MDIHKIRALVGDDMHAVDRLIQHKLRSDVVLISQLGAYIVDSGGKRLRPIVLLLSAGASDYTGRDHIDVAAIIEFIHTATLLHDDVVDESDLRRGRETANTIWGNEASVLVGDFLYSRSFQMMVDIHSMRVMDILANTTNVIAEGEVMQLLYCHDPDTTETRYMDVIYCKTAKLFEAAAQLGAVLAGCPQHQEQAMACYGINLGTAFQLVDDLLDYSSSSSEMGKNIGDDLAEGKPTLPLIYAMRNGSAADTRVIREAIQHGGREDIGTITKTIESTGAMEYTWQLAKQKVDLAIAALNDVPDSDYRTALIGLAEFSLNRTN